MPEPKSTHENLDSPITGQFRSSPFYVAIGAPALAVALDIAAAWVCYRILPPDVARDQMALINPMLLVSGAGGNLLGVGGMIKRGIDITKGKIQAQLPAKLPETVNAGGDVTVGAQTVPNNPVTGIPVTPQEPVNNEDF